MKAPDPAVKFLTTNDPTQFIATIEATASRLSGTFNGAPSDNTAAFTKAFESTSYSSLKEFINEKATLSVSDATLSCGSCDPDDTAQPLPATAPNGLTPAALTTPVYCGMTPKLLELVVAPMDKENDYVGASPDGTVFTTRSLCCQPGGKVISVSCPENNSIKIVEVERQT
ncbi:uncharacterized protein PITG_11934 [Phytophthora infestans T30-4]|uniref:Uncharacterized protein n=1 Tax=Phytophthora infestans (strain T30-4) TaxID=403677 RepID=D0NHK0_PHYIT|nr:uncharacterized protein PITG_11934 [Phytophthora infestans T30-4]EEY58925.1 conserved hypothetical protein [Phytophthora infestans T30-4]|eukprot:XP_002901398.1 conserved hypothetical protein [Phytophthora infestans T30-4]